MSAFPNILFGPEQEQFNPYAATDRRYVAGQILHTVDGREYRWAKAGAATLVVGNVLQSSVPITNHVLQTPAVAGLVGDNSLQVTLGATAATADQYRDGMLVIQLGTGQGLAYPIDTHAAVLSGGVFTVPFKRGIQLQVAVPTTANSVSLIANPFMGVIQAPVTTLTAGIAGVAVKALTANQWGWIQTRGPAGVTTNGTLIIGNNATSPSGAAGAAGPAAATPIQFDLGVVMQVGTTGNTSLVNLNLL